MMYSDAFWRRFIRAAVGSAKQETQLWDFKETIDAWHAKGSGRGQAKVRFAEDVASFANADGGVLIVGVTEAREIVGIGPADHVEDRLKFARDILTKHIDYPREIVSFHQVTIPRESRSDARCLVIVVASAMGAVGVNDGAGQFTFPVRRETGNSRESNRDIGEAKAHAKSDSCEFLARLDQFTKDNGR
jgi:hypothetical protein